MAYLSKYSLRSVTVACLAGLILSPIPPRGLAQETEPNAIAVEAQTVDRSLAEPTDGIYFADVVVRGQPILQIGSLPGLSATERSQIINRRLASLVANSNISQTVMIQTAPTGELATLQVNNRVLMTVTQQDAEDFGLTVSELAEVWTERLNQSLAKPPLAIDVAQRLNTTLRQMARSTIDGIPAVVGAVIVLLLTWLFARGVRFSATAWAQQTEGDRSTEILIGRLGYGGVWLVGAVIFLAVLGINFTALLGALGLTSVAIGFSLKDVLSNYISGVILLAARPFRLGDQVQIDRYEGTVMQVQLRTTTLKTYDGRMVYIPNQEVFQASITNNTASPNLRSSVIVGIDYDADVSQARQVIEAAIATLPAVQADPKPDVLVCELAASTVNLEVRFWVDSRRAGFLETTSGVAQTIKEALQQAEIDMPTEIYTLLIRDIPPQLQETAFCQAAPNQHKTPETQSREG
jgi:small conductance mechanosensitive channel